MPLLKIAFLVAIFYLVRRTYQAYKLITKMQEQVGPQSHQHVHKNSPHTGETFEAEYRVVDSDKTNSSKNN